MSEIEELKREIAELREHARTTDANLAFLVGMLLEDASFEFSFSATATIDAVTHPGWNAMIVERMSAGRETIREAQKDQITREGRKHS